jgi:tetratricopeptide (TPR) repeat protein
MIGIGGLVVVPAACLIAVVLSDDDSDRRTTALTETIAAVEPSPLTTREPQRPVLPVQTPRPRPTVTQATTVRAQHAVSAVESASDKLNLARRLETSDPKRSRELLREVLEADPRNEQALEKLASKVLLDENHEEARDLAKRCREINSRNPVCERVTQMSPEMTPELERMALVVEQCLQADPGNSDCVYAKMQAFLANGKVEEAGPIAEHLAEMNPGSPLALMAQGRIKAASGDYGDARKLLQSACDQGNKDACGRAEMLRNEGW